MQGIGSLGGGLWKILVAFVKVIKLFNGSSKSEADFGLELEDV